jgi:hypothetical protein
VPIMKDISQVYIRRMKALKSAQAVNLAIWAGLNILVASIFIFQAVDYYFYFHAMNASWNLVNTAMAVFLYFHHNKVFEKPISILKQMDYQKHVEKAVAFNLGLDMSFIATGFAMYFYSQIALVNHPELWLGFGISVVIQGTFLLIQDIVFYGLHQNNRNRVYPHWERTLEELY